MWRSGYAMCPDCGSVYYANQLSRMPIGHTIDYVCPNYDCEVGAELFSIDELMIPVIRKLLSLGYKTRFCCSGHHRKPPHNRGYITFRDVYPFETLPDGWIADVDDPYSFTIRATTDDLVSSILALEEWANALPPYEEEDE